jgi:hypothetical protein
MNILLAFVGFRDPYVPGSMQLGLIPSLLTLRDFDRTILLTTPLSASPRPNVTLSLADTFSVCLERVVRGGVYLAVESTLPVWAQKEDMNPGSGGFSWKKVE